MVPPVAEDLVTMDKIVALAKRRGFVFPSSEIYGGLGSTYDYGHYGVLLKDNVSASWWRAMIAGARRHRRARLGDPPAPARVGGQRSPRGLHRPAGGLPHLQAALPGGQARGCPLPAQAVEAPGRGPRLRPDRGARVQPDVRDDGGPGERGRLGRLPAPRDRAGHLHQLQERAAVRAQASRRSGSRRSASRFATRSRPATSSSARASSSRWRWSSSCRPTRRRAGTTTGSTSGTRWYEDLGLRPDHLRLREHDADELSHYSSGDRRRRVPVPDRLVRSSRGSPTAATSISPSTRSSPARSSSTSTRRPASATCPHVIEPAAGADRATLAFLVDAYDEEEVEGEERTVLQAPPAARAGEGRRAAARAQGRPARARARGPRGCCAAACSPSTTRAARSASATAARTRSARRWRDDRPPDLEDRTVTVRDRDTSRRSGSRLTRSPRSWSVV